MAKNTASFVALLSFTNFIIILIISYNKFISIESLYSKDFISKYQCESNCKRSNEVIDCLDACSENYRINENLGVSYINFVQFITIFLSILILYFVNSIRIKNKSICENIIKDENTFLQTQTQELNELVETLI